jgi:hypothetical protein
LTQGEWHDKDIHNCATLNGAINEALRLHPPVPSGVQRTTPKEGMHIGETFIPGGTQYWMPQYVMGRGTPLPSPTSPFPHHHHPKLITPSPSRRTNLPLSPLLPPHPLVHAARPDQAQRRFRALLHRPLRLHRQTTRLHADSHTDCQDLAGV